MENTWLYLAHNCPDHRGSGLRRDHLHYCTNKVTSLCILILHFNKRIGSKWSQFLARIF